MLPKNRRPTHPGEILSKDFLEPLEIPQTRLAEHLGWAPAKVNEICNAKRGITPESALAIAEALGTSPEFWLNLQRNYDLWGAMQEHKSVKRIAG